MTAVGRHREQSESLCLDSWQLVKVDLIWKKRRRSRYRSRGHGSSLVRPGGRSSRQAGDLACTVNLKKFMKLLTLKPKSALNAPDEHVCGATGRLRGPLPYLSAAHVIQTEPLISVLRRHHRCHETSHLVCKLPKDVGPGAAAPRKRAWMHLPYAGCTRVRRDAEELTAFAMNATAPAKV